MVGIVKKIFSKDEEKRLEFSSEKDLENYVRKRLKSRIEEILRRAKEKSEDLEEEWRDPEVIIDDIQYFIEGEEQEEIEPVPRNRKKLHPYKSFAEIVLEELESERKKL